MAVREREGEKNEGGRRGVTMCLMEEGKEQKNRNGEDVWAERKLSSCLCTAPLTVLSFNCTPLPIHRLFSLAQEGNTRLKLFSPTKMSDSVDEQPGDVRSPSYHLPCTLTLLPYPLLRQAVPASQKSTWTQFIKSYALDHCPLSLITRSSRMCSPQHCICLWRSLLSHCSTLYSLPCLSYRVPRYARPDNACPTILCQLLLIPPAYWCERPELFAAISEGATPKDRAKRVLKWFISTLKGQYTSRNETMGSEKKSASLLPLVTRPLVVDTLAQAPQPRARRVRHRSCCGLLDQLRMTDTGLPFRTGCSTAIGPTRMDVG